MKPIDPEGFERLFRRNPDPWGYRTSRFEAAKRRDLLAACGTRIFGRGLELGCAIGETSRPLARHCLRLLAVDAAPTALAEARRRHGDEPRITFRQALLPAGMPRGPFDLIVVSELAYYLSPRDLDRLADGVIRALAPGGRVVVLHHLVPFDDAALRPETAQARLCDRLARRCIQVHRKRTGRYEVAAFVGRRR